MSDSQRFACAGAALVAGGCAAAPAPAPVIRGRPHLLDGDSPLAPETLPPARPDFPLRARPAAGARSTDLAAWARAARSLLDERLEDAGAVLLRGLPLRGVADFSAFVEGLGYEPMRYTGVATRQEPAPRVLTVNRSAPERSIMMHNEMAYAETVPRHLLFYCERELGPGEGGETPIARNADWHDELGEALMARFARRGLKRRLHQPRRDAARIPERSWQARFATDSPVEVERLCRERGLEWCWEPDGSLTTWSTQSTTIEHRGKPLWYCSPQSSRPASPVDFVYGDGSELEPELLARLRAAQWRIAVGFAWRTGDVLCIDNLSCQHGRLSYSPAVDRRVFVSVATPVRVVRPPDGPAAQGA